MKKPETYFFKSTFILTLLLGFGGLNHAFAQRAICGEEYRTIRLIAPQADAYLWDNGSTAAEIIITQAGTYGVSWLDLSAGSWQSYYFIILPDYIEECDKQDNPSCNPSGLQVVKGKVTICHITPGGKISGQLISVGLSALPAHLAHGDQCSCN